MKGLTMLAAVALALTGFLPGTAKAHDEPTSFIDLRLNSVEMEVTVTASVTDLAHDLSGIEPAMLLQEEIISSQRQKLAEIFQSRFKITSESQDILLQFQSIKPVPEKRDLQIVFSRKWTAVPRKLDVFCQLFPYDPRHKTFVNVYAGKSLLRQEIFNDQRTGSAFPTGDFQTIFSVITEFVRQGIHHIFIGPDHILFVVGLMLLGGRLSQLLKIVTSFTIAHSITLALATFRIISPPASIVEPVIALSIVFVGIHALFGKRKHDPRLIFAFCFGLIHGFGFANVLQEMVLPREALGWSLFSFNVGVEMGQACIVLAVAPLLAFVRSRNALVADRVVNAGALGITAAGAFWFFQRVV